MSSTYNAEVLGLKIDYMFMFANNLNCLYFEKKKEGLQYGHPLKASDLGSNNMLFIHQIL